MTEQAALCERADAALRAVPSREWTMEELRALVNLLEAIVEARRAADECRKCSQWDSRPDAGGNPSEVSSAPCSFKALYQERGSDNGVRGVRGGLAH